MSYAYLFVSSLVTLFAIMNPIGAVPILIALTDGYTRNERNNVILKSVFTAAGMMLGFMLIGVYIFQVLRISIYDFEIAGGMLLFKVAFDMLQGRTSPTKITSTEKEESVEREAIGVAPLGTPLLAGPGTITTAIIFFNGNGNAIMTRFVVIMSVIILIILTYIILKFSIPIFARLGKTGSIVITRIMGLLLASIGVQLVASGIINVFHI
ncbi:MarC family protein [Picrophilus oshimae]|uniref:UPF0056 membrane protein n=1 Tax=Picrophilus torridus (strain ATCC 700027 / DSM 9790 / JCM 10055 / NBRC 100828 / KAW 2/3) TaxID=1122961 RepID=A0A8G2FW22_PICTO|nr:MarC family protein [Picrophilus oshimae]SMD30513.1 multiple antibiotic resistance protein [Picrophilus oshimae DSM 9789]